MRSDRIRSTFFRFFDSLGHLQVPRGPLVSDDESLLFTNAGMVQFKPYFLGTRVPPHRRLSSRQPCVRTVDIDNIGRTTRHGTSFEMLGSFAFGDYFKTESTSWALDLLTVNFGLDRKRLWVTVFQDDDETHELWRRLGIPSERIQRLGIKDNYWSMGVPGPSGPNSEIFYDRGVGFGPGGGPAVNSERYLEIWNLVFMQHLRGDSDLDIRGDLPGRHIDTGLGLDRLAMILQDVPCMQEIDRSLPTMTRLRELTGRDDESSSHRIITDHVRTSELLIGEGIVPGNEGRGYVLRRLLRRSLRHLRLLDVNEPVLSRLVDTGREVIEKEERSFSRTLRAGERLLRKELSRGHLTGQTVFKLHDTYGFPVDLTEEIARESGQLVDRGGFDTLMAEHRQRSRR